MNVWQEVLSILKTEVNPQTYQTWLRPTRYSHVAGTTLFVRVPNREFQEWIQEHFGVMIQAAIGRLSRGVEEISYLMEEPVERKAAGNGEPKAVQGKLDF